MKTVFDIAQILVSGLLIAAILLQQRGSGLSSAFGGEGRIYYTKRGIERFLFIGTLILALVFIVLAAIRVKFF